MQWRTSIHDKLLSTLTPKGVSTLYMALAMAANFFGYEFARSANLSLFTSSQFGFSSSSAYPIALSCVSPFSVLLLLGYGHDLKRRGPRLALRNSTLMCITFITISSLIIWLLQTQLRTKSLHYNVLPFHLGHLGLGQIVVWLSFLFQNSYPHLLNSQQWAFICTILTEKQGATYFASIAGLSSIASTLGGFMVSTIVDSVGLIGVLLGAVLSLIACLILSDIAYEYSKIYGFDPTNQMKNSDGSNHTSRGNEEGITKKAYILFRNEPILGALFFETLCFQSLATVGNISLVMNLKVALTDDSDRASWTGKFYAAVNGFSGFLQFFILPALMRNIDSRRIWIYYSVRNVVIELAYTSLNFDSRFLGKEIIGVLGNRLGKSGISILLSSLPFFVDELDIGILMKGGFVLSICWFYTAYCISKREQQSTVAKKEI